MVEFLGKVMQWLENPLFAGVLLFVGGEVLTRWGNVVKRAVPTVLLVMSTLMALLHALFPSLVPAAQAAVAAVAAEHAAPWWVGVLHAVASSAVAVGIHSGSKNTRQWAEFGFRLLETVPRRK